MARTSSSNRGTLAPPTPGTSRRACATGAGAVIAIVARACRANVARRLLARRGHGHRARRNIETTASSIRPIEKRRDLIHEIVHHRIFDGLGNGSERTSIAQKQSIAHGVLIDLQLRDGHGITTTSIVKSLRDFPRHQRRQTISCHNAYTSSLCRSSSFPWFFTACYPCFVRRAGLELRGRLEHLIHVRK
jgi:hypothetical protein